MKRQDPLDGTPFIVVLDEFASDGSGSVWGRAGREAAVVGLPSATGAQPPGDHAALVLAHRSEDLANQLPGRVCVWILKREDWRERGDELDGPATP